MSRIVCMRLPFYCWGGGLIVSEKRNLKLAFSHGGDSFETMEIISLSISLLTAWPLLERLRQ